MLSGLAVISQALRRQGRALSRADDITFYGGKKTGSSVELGRAKEGRMIGRLLQ